MSEQNILKGVLVSEDTTFTFVEVCQQTNLSADLLMDWLEHGLLGERMQAAEAARFNAKMMDRIRMACRLRYELELNMQGVILALELLDEIANMQDELTILKRMSSL
jgi:chaperone modulatory protein CbpM